MKLADSEGGTVWACLPHAEEILVTVPGAFIASQDGQGIAGFLSHRRGWPAQEASKPGIPPRITRDAPGMGDVLANPAAFGGTDA